MSVKKRFAKKSISMMLAIIMMISLFSGVAGPFGGLTASAASAANYPTGVTYSATARVDESVGLRATASIGSAEGIKPTDTRIIRQNATANATNSDTLLVTVTPNAKYTLTGVVVSAIATITHSDGTKEAIKDITQSPSSFTYTVPDFSSYVKSGDTIDVEIVLYADFTYAPSAPDGVINLASGSITTSTGGLSQSGNNFLIDTATARGKTIRITGASTTHRQIYVYDSGRSTATRANSNVHLIFDNAQLFSGGANSSDYKTATGGSTPAQIGSTNATSPGIASRTSNTNRSSTQGSMAQLILTDVDAYVTFTGENIFATSYTTMNGGNPNTSAVMVDASASFVVTDASTGSLYARGGGCSAAIGTSAAWPSGYVEIDGGTITATSAHNSHAFAGIGNGGHYSSTDPGTRGIVINGGKVDAMGFHFGIGANGGNSVNANSFDANIGRQYIVVTGGDITSEASAGSGGAAFGFSYNNDQHEVRVGRPDKGNTDSSLFAVNWGYGAAISGKMTFYSGTTSAYSGQYSAAIGGNAVSNAVTTAQTAATAQAGTYAMGGTPLTVYGGDVTAEAGRFLQETYIDYNISQIRGNSGTRLSAAAVLTQTRPSGLTGSTSSYGAAIGGAVGKSGGTLNNIFAGNFNVTSSIHGAGIGGGGAYSGVGGNGGETWIGKLTDNNTGNTVSMNFNVTSDEYGAGIGGGGSSTGNGGNGGNLYIGGETNSDIVARWDPTMNGGAGGVRPGQYNFNINSGLYGAGIGGGGSLNGNGGFGATTLVISGGNFGITGGGATNVVSYGAGIGGGGSLNGNGGDGPISATIKGGYFNAFSKGYGAAIGGGGTSTGTGGTGGTALYTGGTVVVDVPTGIGSVGMGGGHSATGTTSITDGEVTIIGGNVYTEIASIVNNDATQHAWTLPYAPVLVGNLSNNTSTTTAIKIEVDKSEIGKVPDQVAYRYNGTWYFDYGTNSAYVTADVDGNGDTIGIMWVWVPSEYLLEYDMTSGSTTYTSQLPNGLTNDFDIALAEREAVGFTYVEMEIGNPNRVYNFPGEEKTLLKWNELMESAEVYDGASWGSMAPGANFHQVIVNTPSNRLYHMAEHPQVGGYDVYLIGWTDIVGGVPDGNGGEHIFREGDGKDYTTFIVETVNFSNSDKTVYAMWGDDQNNNGIPDVREGDLTLTYDTNGGVDGPNNNMKYRYGVNANIAGKEPVGSLPAGPATTRDGCVFLGWSDTQIIPSFDITATVAALPAMYRSSGTKTYNGTTLNYSTAVAINNDVILYAVWADDLNGNGIPDFLDDIYYVKHNGNGADTGTVPADIPFVYGQTSIISDTGTGMTWTGTNHIYMGWTEDPNATSLLTSAHTTADVPADLSDPLTLSTSGTQGDKTVYAVWAEDINNNQIPDYLEDAYHFIYNTQTSDVVTGVPADTTAYYENDLISTANNDLLDKTTATTTGGMTDYMKRDGHTLIGWSATIPTQNDYTIAMAQAYLTSNGIYPNDPSLFGSTYLTSIATAGPNGNGTVGSGDASIYAVWAVDSNNNGVPDWDDKDGRVVQYIPTIGSVVNNTMPFYDASTPNVYRDEGPSTSSAFTNYTSGETAALSALKPQSSAGYVFMGWSPVYIGGLVFGENGQNKAEFFTLLALLEDITNGTNVSGSNNVGHMTLGTGLFARAEYTKMAGVSDLYDQAAALGGALTPADLYQIYDAFNWAGSFNGQGLMDTVTFDSFDATMMNLGGDTYSETWRAFAVWATDVNGNGIADIFEDKYTLFYNNDIPSPSFTAATGGPANDYNKYPGQVVPLDLSTANRPGKLDGSYNAMIFLGWTVDPNVQECYGRNDGALIPPMASAVTFGDYDINVYAIWALDDNTNGIPDVYENNIYALTYDANGGVASSVPVDNTSYRYNDVATVDTTTIPTHSGGHIFLYWTDASQVAPTYGFGDRPILPAETTSVTFTNDSVTLNAVWGEDTNNNGIADVYEDQYTLSYNANGGGGAPVDGALYASTNTVTLAAGSSLSNINNYVFVGWTTALPTTFQSVYTFGESALLPTMVTDVTFTNANITVYAVWSTDDNQNQTPDVYENANTFTVTYSANGGSGTLVDSNSPYSANATVTVLGGSSFSRSNYTFSGWNTAAGGTGTSYASGATFTITGNVILYAQWTSVPTTPTTPTNPGTPSSTSYNVTYNANGGSGSKVVSVSSGSSHAVQSVTAVGISYPGYTFKGWNTTANGSGTSHAVATSITVTANITLYAQWEKTDTATPVLERDDHILYIIGYPEGGVRPEASISRAESAMIFFRLLSTTAHIDKNTPVANKFSDIEGTEWHAQAINYLAKYNIISGYEDGTFRPNAPITRAEFATMASRFDELASTGSNIFTDVGSDHWAVSYINSAAKKGWITGYSDNTFKPEQNICRSEAITLVNRVLNRAMDENAVDVITNPYNDIGKDHWAYKAIMEASYAHEYTRETGKEEVWDLSKFKG